MVFWLWPIKPQASCTWPKRLAKFMIHRVTSSGFSELHDHTLLGFDSMSKASKPKEPCFAQKQRGFKFPDSWVELIVPFAWPKGAISSIHES